MLKIRRLPSGLRLSAPWPVRLLNTLGPLVNALGLWPSVDVARTMRKAERHWRRNDWPAPFYGALKARADAFNEDAKLSLFGALAVRGQFEKSADNALAFEDLISKHPEIEGERIDRPLFVLGWPRTGTTLLQRLLSLHDGARFLPFWEAYEPVPIKFGAHEGGRDGRKKMAASRLALLKWISPELDKIHPIGIDDPEECYYLFKNHFLVPIGFDYSYVPSYWQWFDEEAHISAYQLHKRQLQALQWLDPREHWVLKCPNHLSGLKQLMEVYPDARIVYTHRAPEQVIASLCSLVALTWSLTSDKIDLDQVAETVLETAQHCEAAGQAALQMIPPDQVVHVEFSELVADPVAKVLSIYEQFGYRTDPALAGKMSAWLQANPSDKHGKHRYQLSDFGLTADIVRRRLDPASIVAAQ